MWRNGSGKSSGTGGQVAAVSDREAPLVERRGRRFSRFVVTMVGIALTLAACGERGNRSREAGMSTLAGAEAVAGEDSLAAQSCDTAAARGVVEAFGARLKEVSLLAPDSVVSEEIRTAYAPLVTPDLLNRWLAQPRSAPGREVSSPWPERIEIAEADAGGPGVCLIRGAVVYLTSEEVTQGGAAARVPVRVRVQNNGGWRISDYEAEPDSIAGDSAAAGAASSEPNLPGAPPAHSTTAAAAADVIRRYYAAIDARDYRRAYEMWGDSGKNSGQSFAEFAAGFAETATVAVELGEPGRVEGAAGSRYVDIPVIIQAVTVGGEEQHFAGTYTLRRAVVEGATPAEQRWHIYSAKVLRSG